MRDPKRFLRLALTPIALSLCHGHGLAQESGAQPLGFFHAVREAVERSPEVARARLDAAAAGLEEPYFLANTDSQFQTNSFWSDDQAPRPAPAFQGTRSEREGFTAGLMGKTLLGTEAKLAWRNERLRNPAAFRLLDPSAESHLSLEIRQSLLRRFWGRPDRGVRRQARAGAEAARGRLGQAEAEAAAAAARAYLEVYYAAENVSLSEAAVAEARRLVVSHEEKRGYGLVEESDVAQARASLEVRETEALLARSQFERAGNALLAALQRLSPSGADVPAVAPPPDIPVPDAAENEVLQAALDRRSDVAAARSAAEAAEWGLRLTVLDTLPDLAMTGSYGFAGLDRTYRGSWDDLDSFDHPVKSAGLSLTLSLGRRRERLDRESSRISLEAAKRDYERLTQQALREARAAWQNRVYARSHLAASRRLLDLEQKKLKAEKTNYERGRSSTDMLVRFQQDVLRARQKLLRAEADEALARVELGRATGTLLDALNLNR